MHYFLWINSKQQGPYEKQQILDMLLQGIITKQTLCCPADGAGTWNPVRVIHGLLDGLSPPPAPLPSSTVVTSPSSPAPQTVWSVKTALVTGVLLVVLAAAVALAILHHHRRSTARSRVAEAAAHLESTVLHIGTSSALKESLVSFESQFKSSAMFLSSDEQDLAIDAIKTIDSAIYFITRAELFGNRDYASLSVYSRLLECNLVQEDIWGASERYLELASQIRELDQEICYEKEIPHTEVDVSKGKLAWLAAEKARLQELCELHRKSYYKPLSAGAVLRVRAQRSLSDLYWKTLS